MEKPSIPLNETERLAALRALRILDTHPEERFDRLTRLAQRFFQVPIALVSLIDEERQWFKSCIGLNVLETSRDISFCGHTILGDHPFVIPDTLLDTRFADNPLVTGYPNIRFYAGCPIKLDNGLVIGTLCIIDVRPRSLTTEEVQVLQDLTALVEREIAALQLAWLDALTQISNRRGFENLVEQSLAFYTRQNIQAILVYMDLNAFKLINDTYGHLEGDKALIDFSIKIQQACRNADVIGRIGGDEFAVLLGNANRTNGHLFVQRLQELLNHPHQKEPSYTISFAYGIVEFDPTKPQPLNDMLKQADKEMYLSKKGQLIA